MLPVEAAILRTVLYADVFNFPLTADEIQRYLIHDRHIDRADIDNTLRHSRKLKDCLHQAEGYICRTSRESIIHIRKEREQISKELWQSAMQYGQLLSHIPFVRMVVLTGALAVRNPASIDDDYDYLLVTKPGRVWLARAFAIVLVRLVRLRGRELCPNYVLASDNLVQSRQDLYMAHEVAQMRPIYGANNYRKMIEDNLWMQDYLPNAIPFDTIPDKSRRIRKALEWLLSGWIGDRLEQWEYRRKLDKFKSKTHQAQSTAEINRNSVKGHFEDHGMPVLTRYEDLLYEYGLVENVESLAGD